MKYRSLIFLSIALFFSKNISAQSNPKISINEFLASNLSTNPEMVDFDSFSDWIELYNDEASAVNIGGYYLSDNFALPTKWQFPPNTIIPAKGFYLVWADGYNDVPGKNYVRNWWPNNIPFTTQWCHTNFKLDKEGERIGLFNSIGTLIDSVTFSSQATDVSFGRKPDGSTNWFYFGEPTPLLSNASIEQQTLTVSGDVMFSAEGGFYQSSLQVTLSSSTGNGTIRFTTDGSKPANSSAQYTAPITINSTMVLRARVFESSKLPGTVTTNSYFIDETRNLPVVSLVSDPAFLWDRKLGIYVNSYKEREIPVCLEYFPLNSGRAFYLDAGARIGGQNIFRFAQKPFNIFARSDYGYPHIEYKVFDHLPYQQFKELYLRNGGSEWPNTIMRDGTLENVLKDRITNSMMAYKPASMYLNGVYWGICDIREKIDKQYFFLHNNVDPANLDHIEDTYKIIAGDSSDFVNVVSYAALNDLSEPSTYEYVQSKIDIHDLMDFVIVQDFIANTSWGHNREMWRDRVNQPLWRWVLVDLDRGYVSGNITLNLLNDLYNNFGLFHSLCSNTTFTNEFIQRYSHHLNTTFNTARVIGIIDSIQTLLNDEMPRHIQKWGTLIDSLSIDGGFGKKAGITSMSFWNSEVQKMRNFAVQRPQYAIQYLSSRFGLTGRENLKITTNVQNQGKVFINGFMKNMAEDDLYFKNVPLPITVYPPPGYAFKQWKEIVPPASEKIISTEPSISYTIKDSTELIAEFDPVSASNIQQIINEPLTLSKANSPYYVQNDVTIESNGILTVEPGTVIYFSQGKGMHVKGKLLFKGTAAEPVTLTSYYPFEKWGAVCMDSGSTCEMKFVDISNATQGNDPVIFFAAVSGYKSSLQLKNVHFNNVKSPVSSQWSDTMIDSCLFENITDLEDYINCNGGRLTVANSVFIGNALSDMDAIDLGFMTDTTKIQHNIIRDFSGSNSDAIDIGDASKNVVIEDNTIMNCTDKGVSVGQGSKVFIFRNVIAGCNLGVGVKDSLSHADILSCTFFSDNVGVACYEKNLNHGGGSAAVRNSLFANSTIASFTVDALSSVSIDYSLSNTEALAGIGNVFDEPLMINPGGGNFHLQTNSPCIDKGDPASPTDMDGTIAEIGAMAYAGASDPVVVINEINYNSSLSFDSGDWIELCNSTGEAIDLSGWVFMDENRTPSLAISNGTVLQPGSYIVLCGNVQLFTSLYPGVTNYLGSLNSGLSGNGEALFLYDASGRLVDSLTYNDQSPWPAGADGAGSSLELENPSLENSTGINWNASIGHGTPGTKNSTYVADTEQNSGISIPSEFFLKQNYPNPFNPSTTISFGIPVQAYVTLKMYDLIGREVAAIVSRDLPAGYYSQIWNAAGMPSGVYFYTLRAKNFTATKKFVLLK